MIPFDWQKPLPYIFVITSMMISLFYMLAIAIEEITFAFIFGWRFYIFAGDMSAELVTLNKYKKTKGKTNNAEIYTKLSNVVEFHVKVKQLSCVYILCLCEISFYFQLIWFFRLFSEFADTYMLIYTTNLLWTLATMSVSLLIVHVQMVMCLY